MGHVTGSIFCLDLGVTSGFARGRPGDVPVSGTVRLKKPSETIDVAYANLDWFLREEFEARRHELVIKEKMLSLQAFATIGNAEKTVRAHAAYHGIVELVCVQYGIAWDDVADSTARKHFLGRAHMGSRDETKAAVVARCQLLGLIPKDCREDNRADACCIHDWACANFGSRSASISNFALFDQGGKKRA
jgi:hypothetical protein